ncbi:MAG: carboxymuconolactone decarboxylase family protein [Novosphingobium sp.]|nr:carboxymuconolactone decarboxylase family protein [Novosphingobium sp.]
MTRITILQPEGRDDAILPHGYRPRMADAMEQLAQAVYQETTLSFREAEAARIRIAFINGCLMCQGYRIAEMLPDALKNMDSGEAPNVQDRGEAPGDDFYRAASGEGWRDDAMLSTRERLAIEYAEKIALTPVPLPYDDDFWDRLHANYDEGEIADLSYSITCWIATGRMVHILGIDGSCDIGVGAQAVAAE